MEKMMVFSFLMKIYRTVFSPAIQLAFNVHCRYEETCSCYTERMVSERGFLKGALLGLKRIASCNQFTS